MTFALVVKQVKVDNKRDNGIREQDFFMENDVCVYKISEIKIVSNEKCLRLFILAELIQTISILTIRIV